MVIVLEELSFKYISTHNIVLTTMDINLKLLRQKLKNSISKDVVAMYNKLDNLFESVNAMDAKIFSTKVEILDKIDNNLLTFYNI
jgi:hypothetical protein